MIDRGAKDRGARQGISDLLFCALCRNASSSFLPFLFFFVLKPAATEERKVGGKEAGA